MVTGMRGTLWLARRHGYQGTRWWCGRGGGGGWGGGGSGAGGGGGCRMLDVQATDSTRLMTLRPPLKNVVSGLERKAAARLATISATRWTGNNFFFRLT